MSDAAAAVSDTSTSRADALFGLARRLHAAGLFATRLDAPTHALVAAALESHAAWRAFFLPPPAPPAPASLSPTRATTARVKRTYGSRRPTNTSSSSSARPANNNNNNSNGRARRSPSPAVAVADDGGGDAVSTTSSSVLSGDPRVVAAFRVRSLLFDELLRESARLPLAAAAGRLDDMYYVVDDASDDEDEQPPPMSPMPRDARSLFPRAATLAALSRGAPLVPPEPLPVAAPPVPAPVPVPLPVPLPVAEPQPALLPVPMAPPPPVPMLLPEQAALLQPLSAPPPLPMGLPMGLPLPQPMQFDVPLAAMPLSMPLQPVPLADASLLVAPLPPLMPSGFFSPPPPPLALSMSSGGSRPLEQYPTSGAHTSNAGDDDDSRSDSPSLTSSTMSGVSRRSSRKRSRVSRSTRAVLTGSRQISRTGDEDEELKEAAALRAAMTECLKGLSGFGQRSAPFLQPVRKTDAPDYFDVIKNPMDLGTMIKKVQRGEYLSKASFEYDLNLIWNNCRTYNVGPASKMFVEHANYMEVQANRLLKYVPDVDLARDSPRSPLTGEDASRHGGDDSFDTYTTAAAAAATPYRPQLGAEFAGVDPVAFAAFDGAAAYAAAGVPLGAPVAGIATTPAAAAAAAALGAAAGGAAAAFDDPTFPPLPVVCAVDATRSTLAAHIAAGETQEQCWSRVAGAAVGAARQRARQQRRALPFDELPALVRDAGSMGASCAEASGFVHPASLGCFPELRPVRSSVPPLPIAVADNGSGMSVRRTALAPVPLTTAANLSGCVATALLRAGFVSASRGAVDVLRDLLDSFLVTLGRTLRLRADQASGDDAVRRAANAPLRPLLLASSALDDMGATVSLEALHRFLQREQHVHAAAVGHVRTLMQRNDPVMPDERTLFDQALILAHRSIMTVQPTLRERAALMSTQTEAYSEDLDARPFMTDYGIFGKRRAVLQQMWYGDDGREPQAPPLQPQAPPPSLQQQLHQAQQLQAASAALLQPQAPLARRAPSQMDGIAPGVGAHQLAASMTNIPPLMAGVDAAAMQSLALAGSLPMQTMLPTAGVMHGGGGAMAMMGGSVVRASDDGAKRANSGGVNKRGGKSANQLKKARR